jgi:hypothetical protein
MLIYEGEEAWAGQLPQHTELVMSKEYARRAATWLRPIAFQTTSIECSQACYGKRDGVDAQGPTANFLNIVSHSQMGKWQLLLSQTYPAANSQRAGAQHG